MPFSFLNRRKKKKQQQQNPYSDRMSYAPTPTPKPAPQRQSYQRSSIMSGGESEGSSEPYAMQQLADGRVRYSDGSIRGQAVQQKQQQQRRQPQQQRPSTGSLTDQYVQQQRQRANQRVGNIAQRAQQRADVQQQLRERRQKTLEDIGNIQKESFGNYADQIRKGVDIQRGSGKRQINRAEQDYYDQRRMNERANQERMKGLENTLAGLGTLQSSAMMNVGARINEGTQRQQMRADRAYNDRVAEIQDSIRMAENQAETLIQQEAANYRQQAAALADSMDTNTLEFQNALIQLQENAEQNINSVLDSLDAFEYQAQLQMLENQQAGNDQLSNEFLTTGQPVSRADMIWAAENPEKLQSLQNQLREQTGQMSPQKQEMARVVDELLALNTNPISGVGRMFTSRIPGQTQTAKNLYDKLSGMLTLENIDKLRGTGAISDRETQILQQAASELGTNLSDTEFRRVLRSLKDNLEGQNQQAGDYQNINNQLVQQFGG